VPCCIGRRTAAACRSSTATCFGLVPIEASACETPVAAFPITGPIDVVSHGATGALDTGLRAAALKALTLDRATFARHGAAFSCRAAAEKFIANLLVR